jgi:hypothetical protein
MHSELFAKKKYPKISIIKLIVLVLGENTWFHRINCSTCRRYQSVNARNNIFQGLVELKRLVSLLLL